jgi:O-antigen ligase
MGKEFLRPYGTFSHPNSLAGFYLLLFAFVRTQRRIANHAFRLFFLCISSALILISFSRTAIVAYIVLLLVYYVKERPGCRICVLGKYAILLFLLSFALSISGDIQNIEKRTDFTRKSIAIIAHAPLTGTGLGGYLIAQHAYPQKFPIFFEQPVHSIALLSIAQLGLPLAALVLLFICGYIGKKITRREVLLPLLAVGITGLFDHYWLTLPQNLFLSATLFGILISIYEKQTAGD